MPADQAHGHTRPSAPARRVRAGFTLLWLLWLTATWAGILVVDGAGHPVSLPHPARRVITLSPHAAELVFEAGAGQRLVGTTAGSDYPPAARRVPRIGDASRLDREALLALAPDLVVAWPSGNRPQDLAWLQRSGIPVYRSDPPGLEAIAADLRALGRLTGTAAAADATANAFLARLARLRVRYRGAPRLRVFYQLWPRPLMTVGARHIVTQVLGLCGASSVFPQIRTPAATVSREAVIRADPDAIVAAVGDADEGDPFAAWRRWSQLAAVRDGRLVAVPAALIHRPTPAILDGAEIICRGLTKARTQNSRERPGMAGSTGASQPTNRDRP
jgi:iron complex transport system substrate-binding protein